YDQLYFFRVFPHEPQGIYERREDNDRRAVLVVVHDGNIEFALQALLDLETARRGDVFQVDAPEADGNRFYRLYDFLRILSRKTDGISVHAGKFLEERGLALHDGERR